MKIGTSATLAQLVERPTVNRRGEGSSPPSSAIPILRYYMPKTEISLSPKAVQTINELLTSGARAQIDYDPRTGELKIYEVPRMKTKYKVVVAAG